MRQQICTTYGNNSMEIFIFLHDNLSECEHKHFIYFVQLRHMTFNLKPRLKFMDNINKFKY